MLFPHFQHLKIGLLYFSLSTIESSSLRQRDPKFLAVLGGKAEDLVDLELGLLRQTEVLTQSIKAAAEGIRMILKYFRCGADGYGVCQQLVLSPEMYKV